MNYKINKKQKELLLIHELQNNKGCVYNEPLSYKITGPLCIKSIEKASEYITQYYQILSSSFPKKSYCKENSFAYITNKKTKVFSYHKIKNSNKEKFILINKYIIKPFNMYSDYMIKIALFEEHKNEYYLVFLFHHIVIDGRSIKIIIEKFFDLYDQFKRNKKLPVIEKIDNELDSTVINKTESYKKNLYFILQMLNKHNHNNFFNINNTNIDKIYEGNRIYFKIKSTRYSKITTFSKDHNFSKVHTLLSAYFILISRYSQENTPLIGVPFMNRYNVNNKDLIGYFTNILPIKLDINKKDNFIDITQKLRNIILLMLDKQDIMLSDIVEKIDLKEKKIGYNQLINSIFSFTNYSELPHINIEGTDFNIDNKFHTHTSKFALSLYIIEEKDNYATAYFEYNVNTFKRYQIKSMVFNFLKLIDKILSDPVNFNNEKSFFTKIAAEKFIKKMYHNLNYIKHNITLIDVFKKTAKENPQKLFIKSSTSSLTYLMAEHITDNIKANIINKAIKIKNGDNIIIYMTRSIDSVLSIIGILKTGGAYISIDPNQPRDRIEFMVNELSPKLIISTKELQDDHIIKHNKHITLYIEDLKCNNTYYDHCPVIKPKNIAYVIYTSGSTGNPKGVMITHENVVNLLQSVSKKTNINHNQTWSLLHELSFDISVWEIWGAIFFKGSIYLVDNDEKYDPKILRNIIKNEKITILNQTPQAFEMLLREDLKQKSILNLNYIFFAGESISIPAIEKWIKKYGDKKTKLINMYGSTEATVHSSYKKFTKQDVIKCLNNIGTGIPGTNLYVLDHNLEVCPVSIQGEIFISSYSVSKGYINRPKINKNSFFIDNIRENIPGHTKYIMYKTGDFGKLLPDGSIEYIGRKDSQVKIRGFRIDLQEIQSKIIKYKNIKNALVITKGTNQNTSLIAFYNTSDNINNIVIKELTEFLSHNLPYYMIPKRIVYIKEFPMTKNGKIDKELLLKQDCISLSCKEEKLEYMTNQQKKIQKIWAILFNTKTENVKLNSNFFNIGGNSILAVQMLDKVRKITKYNIPIIKFMYKPTINFITTVEYQNNAKKIQDIIHNILNNELKEYIQYYNNLYIKDNTKKIVKNVLITGTTGFLGSQLLFDLLHNKKIENIYCIVRKKENIDITDRLYQVINKLNNTVNKEKITIIEGDISKEKLGLSEKNFNLIVNKADTIIHCAAKVNHLLDLTMLYESNIKSIVEIIKLSLGKITKSIHFISTISTEKLYTISENDKIGFVNGYITSKFIVEKILLSIPSNVKIYRPGNIVGNKKKFPSIIENNILSRLKGILDIKVAYKNDKELIEMIPVDILSKEIIDICINDKTKKVVYNMHNKEYITWYQYLLYFITIGYEIKFVDKYEDWIDILDRLDKNNPLYKLKWVYKIENNESLQITAKSDIKSKIPSYSKIIKNQIKHLNQTNIELKNNEVLHE